MLPLVASRDTQKTPKPASGAGSQRLRRKDSNFDYLIQRPLPAVFACAVAYRGVASDAAAAHLPSCPCCSVTPRHAAAGFNEGFSAIHSHRSSFEGEADR